MGILQGFYYMLQLFLALNMPLKKNYNLNMSKNFRKYLSEKFWRVVYKI